MPDSHRRKKANKDSPTDNPSHSTSEHCTLNEGPSHRTEDRRIITVLFGERGLQKTIDIHASTTVSQAKKIGADKLVASLRLQLDLPSDSLSIDESCTDFYPGMI